MKRLQIEEIDNTDELENLNKFKSINELGKFYNIEFDTIVADCEGFFDILLIENYDYFDKIKLIILEKDNSADCNYFIVDDMLKEKGLNLVKIVKNDNVKHCVYVRGSQVSIRTDENSKEVLEYVNQYVLGDKQDKIIANNVNNNERDDVIKFIHTDAKVLELGGRYGQISCVINTILNNKENMVVVEPDKSVIKYLKQNMERNKCNFHIYNGIISNKNYELKLDDYGTCIKRNIIGIDNVDNLVELDLYSKYQLSKFNIKTKLIPIKNHYEKYQYNKHDFNVNIFYKNKNTILIRVRRVDDIFGWNTDNLKIAIFPIDNLNSGDAYKLNIDSDCLFKELELELPFDVEPMNLDYESKIPKIIIQTSEDNKFKSLYHVNAFYSMLEFNPEFEYRFFDAKERRKFMKEHFPGEVLDAYDAMIPGSFKADLFKYCILYLVGGCYMDNKFLMRKSIRKIIQENSKVNCYDPSYDNARYTAIMYHEPGDIRFWNCIKMIIHNVNIKLSTFTLEVSGPMVQYKNFKDVSPVLKSVARNIDQTIKHRYIDNYIEYKGEVYINCFFRDYYHHSYISYDDLFKAGLIYYDNKIDNGDHKIYTFPTELKYNIIMIDNSIIVKRIDENKGWDNDLVLHIIFEDNRTLDLKIGPSKSSYKIISYTR